MVDRAPSSREVDAQIAKELAALSTEERTQLYEGIHGVDPIIEETPEFVEGLLLELDEEINALLSLGGHESYKMARTENPGYVEDPKFRLQFLRADYFDAKKAARRLLEFMYWKLKLFGRQCLSRRILLEDLNDETRRVIQSGLHQILPCRDRGDRVVLLEMNIANGPPPAKSPIDMVWDIAHLCTGILKI